MESMARTERYMGSKTVFSLIGVVFLLMIALYIYISGQVVAGMVAAVVMLIVGFFFATVSGNLVGMIGSSNNPISGLTLSTLIIAALLMVALGVSGPSGVAVVLGVAAVVCVSSAVAGELLQDFKAGYILGGTPRIDSDCGADRGGGGELGDVFSAVHSASRRTSRRRDGVRRSSAAGAAGGIDGGAGAGNRRRRNGVAAGGGGALFGVALIMVKVRSPMLVAVGMYLPFPTTFAIFVGGMLRWIDESASTRARAQRSAADAASRASGF